MSLTILNVGGGVSVEYHTDFLPSGSDSKHIFDELLKLQWIHHENVPRKEYFIAKDGSNYTYGKGEFARTYAPQLNAPVTLQLWKYIEDVLRVSFDYCFLNYYPTGKDSLGWHADDSPEMDPARPIAVVSFGAAREIFIREYPRISATHQMADPKIVPIKLEDDSLLLMPAGMQQTHQHKIPRASNQNSGPRISLTFRGKTPEKELKDNGFGSFYDAVVHQGYSRGI